MDDYDIVEVQDDEDSDYDPLEQPIVSVDEKEKPQVDEEYEAFQDKLNTETMSNWHRVWSANNPNLSALAQMASDAIPFDWGEKIWHIGEGEDEPAEFSENVKNSWEGRAAAKYPTLASVLKVGASFTVPFESQFIPSSKEDFDKLPASMKSLVLGVELISLATLPLIATPIRGFFLKTAKQAIKWQGIKMAAKKADDAIKPALNAMAKANPKAAAIAKKAVEMKKAYLLKKEASKQVDKVLVDPYSDKLMKDIPEYIYKTPIESAAKAYGITQRDAKHLLNETKDGLWKTVNKRSGSTWYDSQGMNKIRKTEKFRKNVEKWDIPQGVQRQMHYNKHLEKQLNKVLTGTKIKADIAFNKIASKLYGDNAIGMTMKNAPTDVLANVMLSSIKQEHGVLKGIDIGKMSWFRTSRRVFAKYDKMYGVKDKIYNKFGTLVQNSNKTSFMNMTSWHAILQAKGLGKIGTKGGSYKFKELYHKADLEAAGKLVTDIDNLTAKGGTQAAMNDLFNAQSDVVQKLSKSWTEWSDLMYGNHMKSKIGQAFEGAKLTNKGNLGFQASMNGATGINRYIDEVLSSASNLSQGNKKEYTEKILGQIVNSLDDGKLNWFSDKPIKDMTKQEIYQVRNQAKALRKKLTTKKNGGEFMDYTENYGLRIGKKPGLYESVQGVPGKAAAGYTKARMMEEFAGERVTNLADLVNIRSRMQAKELNINPYMKQVQASIKDLPPELKKYSEHYIQRMLGMTSDTDNKVAAIIRKQFGVGISGDRIARIGQTMNNLVYMGALGLKPFSAMRNLFQPLMMVPTDMGGVKDIYWLAKGYKRAFSEEGAKYVRSIGAIQDFAPDLVFMNKASKLGETIKVGKHTLDAPTMQSIQDTCLYLYKSSDIGNRMVTGCAASAKWDHYINRYTKNGVLDKKRFVKKMKIHLRASDSAKNISKMIMKGSEEIGHGGTRNLIKDAKAAFCNDVINDTQYLYNSANSPLISSSKGALTKTGFLFQSWWMNYGEAFAKWSTRGTVPEKTEKMFTFLLTSAMAYQGMRLIWDKGTAARTVVTGPLPLEPNLPATWKPTVDAVRLVAKSVQAVSGMGDINEAKKQFKNLIRSTGVFAPGGIQIQQTARRTMAEGGEGFLKSIIKYKKD